MIMRLPKPIYETLPYVLIAIGILFVYLVLLQYEYAPTLFIWLLGIFCIIAGAAMIIARLMFRHAARTGAESDDDEDDDD